LTIYRLIIRELYFDPKSPVYKADSWTQIYGPNDAIIQTETVADQGESPENVSKEDCFESTQVTQACDVLIQTESVADQGESPENVAKEDCSESTQVTQACTDIFTTKTTGYSIESTSDLAYSMNLASPIRKNKLRIDFYAISKQVVVYKVGKDGYVF
jgi:hypothetical protein